jgi:protein SCO1/2
VKRQVLIRIFQATTGVILGLVLALGLLRRGNSSAQGESDSHFLEAPLPAPEFTLTGHHGEEFHSFSSGRELLAVFFGYTFCPDVCPLTLSHLSSAFREMGEEGQRIQVLLITVDPSRDTPERLKAYLEVFHPSFLGLTGTEAEIRAVADAFGAFFSRSGEGEAYTVDHTARTFIIDRSGRIPLTFPVTATPAEMVRDLTLLLENGR